MRAAGAAFAVVFLGGALGACSSSKPPDRCTPGGDGTYTTELYEDLARYCMVEIRDGEVATSADRVLPYELVTPGFSDYAVKRRTVWVPPGTAATYRDDDEVFDFPRGTIITKSFGFPRDAASASTQVQWLETRILVRSDSGWTGAAYLWNEEQSAAHKQPGGAIRPLDVRATDGSVQHANYLVPSQQQCPKCHGSDMKVVPIGPRRSGLDRGDQLARWSAAGLLSGAPAVSQAPPPAWDDAAATVDARARSYLAANCGFCHSAKGEARTTGLFLTFAETDTTRLGRCKSPIAAGAATSNLSFDIVPGEPDASILLHRMIATEPSIAMPEIGRSVVHREGVQLVRDWIAGMTGDCPPK
ncbi:MAG TPA: SO2930 family diheme c-type cytochrome [Labilithrix sp.]|nr:SO2930 family diheme c-type cytochrome [Labilithrix sp.]